MPIAPSRFFVALAQAIKSVLTYRLQQSITRRAVVLFDTDKVLVGQGRKEIDRVGPLDSGSRADVLRRRQRPPTGADSTGQCNRLMESFSRCFVV